MVNSNLPETILIVDDEIANILTLSKLLRTDYLVYTADSGEKALEIAFSGNSLDLILLDINMSGIDGYEVCRQLKQNNVTRNIPVIFLTAQNTSESEVRGFEVGAVDYVTKPFNPLTIHARVRTHVELKRYRDNLERLTVIDPLTGIANRRQYDKYLGIAWDFASRSKTPLTIIIVDIDNFKNFNDNYGHQAGDTCLCQVAQALSGCVRRKIDLIARFGGEEFVGVLPQTNLENGLILAEKMRKCIFDLAIAHNYSSAGDRVTISLGVTAMIPSREYSLEKMVRAADVALYEAKNSGRNRVCEKLYE